MINIAATAALGLATVLAAPSGAAADNGAARTIRQGDNAPLVPSGHREVSRRMVSVGGGQALLTRYEREDGRNAAIGGEHYSTIFDAKGWLEGCAHMSLDLVNGPLPSQKESEEIAMRFLGSHAPDLLPGLRIGWIDRHDEALRVVRGGRTEDLTLTGMKVKMRNPADGRRFWVIVGADRAVTVLEHDIVWNTFPGRRQTEKWLHDGWLVDTGLVPRRVDLARPARGGAACSSIPRT